MRKRGIGWKGQRRQWRWERSKGQDAKEDDWGEVSSWKVGGRSVWGRSAQMSKEDWIVLVSTIKVHKPCTLKYLFKNLSIQCSSALSQVHLVFDSISRENCAFKHCFCKDISQIGMSAFSAKMLFLFAHSAESWFLRQKVTYLNVSQQNVLALLTKPSIYSQGPGFTHKALFTRSLLAALSPGLIVPKGPSCLWMTLSNCVKHKN